MAHRHVNCTECVCEVSKPVECELVDSRSSREIFLATIDQQAAACERLREGLTQIAYVAEHLKQCPHNSRKGPNHTTDECFAQLANDALAAAKERS